MGCLMDGEPAPAGGGLPPATPPPAVDPAVARLTASLEQTRGQVEQLRRQVLAPAQPAPVPGAPPTRQEMERQFMQAPVDMTAAIAQRTVQEAMQRFGANGFDTQVEMAMNLARGTNPDDQTLWDRYLPEIQGAVAQVDPQLRINSTVWRNAFQMVKGAHVDDIIASRQAAQTPQGNQSPAVHVRTGNQSGVPSKAPAAPTAEKLTDDEARFAKKFRIEPEEYLAGKKANLAQSDFIMDPLGKSSWDDHITFSSRDARRKAKEEKKRAATTK